jgi:hypothetical protein
VYRRFDKNRIGANDHYVRFKDGQKKIALKKLEPRDWTVVPAAKLSPVSELQRLVELMLGGSWDRHALPQSGLRIVCVPCWSSLCFTNGAALPRLPCLQTHSSLLRGVYVH